MLDTIPTDILLVNDWLDVFFLMRVLYTVCAFYASYVQMRNRKKYMSSEKRAPGCLGYIGDKKLRSYVESMKPL